MSQQVAELQGGSSLQVLVETLLRDLGEFTASQQSLTTRLRVVGDTGIVTQTVMREAVVDGRKVVRYLRTTAVYVRSPDGWRLMSWHTSDAPLKK
jgi:ketosteroid isomerase-like protein